MPDAAAVDLNANLQISDAVLLGDGLDAQARGVGVGTNDGDGVARAPLGANSKGYDGRSIASEIVFAAGAEARCPRVTLADLGEAGFFEAGDGGLAGVVS